MKTSELTGAALDWAAAVCEGYAKKGAFRVCQGVVLIPGANGTSDVFNPATNWSHGGPIIEREGISLYLDTNNLWQANIFDGNPAVFGTGVEGSTPLIAAMRCYVASKLGENVDIPKEIMQ